MALLYEMVCKDAASLGLAAETVEKDNMCSFLFGFPHRARQLCSLWAWRTTLYTLDKSTQTEKKYQGTKALLCNAVKLH